MTDDTIGVPRVDGLTFHRLEQSAANLGRHVLHDVRSLEHDAAVLVAGRTAPLKTVMHRCTVDPWDQGDVGGCTANAAIGLLVTEPFAVAGRTFTEADALELYKEETRLDDSQIPGHYPAEDTGSTGLWSMKALKARGMIKGYRHAFSLGTALRLLQSWPVSTGVPWFNSMFNVDAHGFIKVDQASGLAGGHQVAIVGIDVDRKAVRVRNSWGTGWGDGGYAWLSWSDWKTLLHLHGDVVVPEV
ncbi:C1 family peptidase [Amycolatopsis sp. NPDC005961]|uniref:C1 family peptidase n=1 Tax=Amycolatopsis sp. NPDC005961 TaxID=3156720 RepID=UPI0033CD034B